VRGELSDGLTIAESLRRPESFAAIFDRHFRAVHRYLARRVGGERAEDLAASTFVVAFERRHSFRAEATTARPWLLGIATNLIRERCRDDAREVAAQIRLGAELPTPGAADNDGDPGAIARLAVAVSQLDWEQREVLLLYAWADLAYNEIAESLGIPVGTVRSRLSRARRHLRAELHRVPAESQPVKGGDSDDR
jgi:RNA polymerase sigma factor (sigma-70 family)